MRLVVDQGIHKEYFFQINKDDLYAPTPYTWIIYDKITQEPIKQSADEYLTSDEALAEAVAVIEQMHEQSQANKYKGPKGSITLSWGKNDGVYFSKGEGMRLGLGPVAITYLPIEIDDLVVGFVKYKKIISGAIRPHIPTVSLNKKNKDNNDTDTNTDTDQDK